MRLPAKRQVLWIALPAALVLLILLFFPFRYQIEFDTDEGVNAIKAMMVLRGYRLYSQIWSDQPPLFTFLLAAWFRLFGLRLTAGRILVLLFSAGVAGLAAAYLRKSWGLLAAACAVFLLALLPYFLRLSVSMMIGLPAIALAIASFYMLAEWHVRPTPSRLAASGALLGLSILTKGFTAILVPLWLTGIAIAVLKDSGGKNRGWSRWIGPAAFLAALGLVIGVPLLIVARPENLGQLVGVHLEASRNDLAFSFERRTLNSYLAESLPLFALAALGAWFAARHKKWTALYLAGWIVAGYGLLALTGPTWYHHQLLVTIPAALLAAIAIATSIDELRLARVGRPNVAVIALGLASIGLPIAFSPPALPGRSKGCGPACPISPGRLRGRKRNGPCWPR
jgi:4-amino-4-deoxy-L-arabinose transferase-like glycosyltransferase